MNRKKYCMHFMFDKIEDDDKNTYYHTNWYLVFLFGLLFVRPWKKYDRVLIDIVDRNKNWDKCFVSIVGGKED